MKNIKKKKQNLVISIILSVLMWYNVKRVPYIQISYTFCQIAYKSFLVKRTEAEVQIQANPRRKSNIHLPGRNYNRCHQMYLYAIYGKR